MNRSCVPDAELGPDSSVAYGGQIGSGTKLARRAAVWNLAVRRARRARRERRGRLRLVHRRPRRHRQGHRDQPALPAGEPRERPTRIGRRCWLMHVVSIGQGTTIGNDSRNRPLRRNRKRRHHRRRREASGECPRARRSERRPQYDAATQGARRRRSPCRRELRHRQPERNRAAQPHPQQDDDRNRHNDRRRHGDRVALGAVELQRGRERLRTRTEDSGAVRKPDPRGDEGRGERDGSHRTPPLGKRRQRRFANLAGIRPASASTCDRTRADMFRPP